MIFAKVSRWLKGLLDNAPQAKKDIDWEIRADELTEALYHTGMPRWLAKRNAIAFMTIRPHFDLKSPKSHRIRKLLEFHQDEFLGAYLSVAQQHGKSAADAWVNYVRSQDIVFCRIAALPKEFDIRYLFGV